MIVMLVESMKLASNQGGKRFCGADGRIVPVTECDVAYCENLRESVAGQLKATGSPRLIAEGQDKIVATDVRGDVMWLFSLSADNVLRVVGGLDARNDFYPCDEILADIGQGVKGYGSTGAFLVLLLDDGSLYYLLWDYLLLTYKALGKLPEMPRVEASAADATEFVSVIEAVDFKEPIADMRDGTPSDVAEQVGAKLLDAWKRAESSAHDAGMWVQPVTVRLAYRLWDGRYLHVSEPQMVGVGYQGLERVLLPLKSDASGFVGTAAVNLRLKAYRIALKREDLGLAGWDDVIASTEVWVSKEQSVVEASREVDVSQVQTSSGLCLSAYLPTSSESDLSSMLASCLVGRHSEYESFAALAERLEWSETVKYKESAPTAGGFVRQADMIYGRGDFLHLVRGLDVVTMQRGNPLVQACCTSGVGGEIFALSSQCVGGGAYTRQFIYLFTNRGIMALTHKADGKHSNCRIISPAVVDDVRCVVATSSGVYAKSCGEELLRLNDARVSVVLSGVDGCESLGWNSSNNELWLIPGKDLWMRSLVLQIAMEFRAFLSTIVPGRLVSNDGHLIYEQTTERGHALFVLNEEDETELLRAKWVSSVELSEGKSLREAIVGIVGEAVDCVVEISKSGRFANFGNVAPHAGQTLVKADVKGNLDVPIRLGVIRPRMKLLNVEPSRCLTISVEGKFSQLNGVKLLTYRN